MALQSGLTDKLSTGLEHVSPSSMGAIAQELTTSSLAIGNALIASEETVNNCVLCKQQGSRHNAAATPGSTLSLDTVNELKTVFKESMMMSRFCRAKTLKTSSANDVSISRQAVRVVTTFAVGF